jgi:DNA-binding Xre family transcriptional regulator
MLILNLRRVFALRGINNPHTQLVKLGIASPTAWNLLDNKVSSIRSKHLEMICEYLKCEPNDLYEWRPDSDSAAAGDHPLKRLRRSDEAKQYKDLIGSIPLDKIDKVRSMLEELKNEE